MRAEADRALSQAQVAWESALNTWRQQASPAAFYSKRKELEKLRATLKGTPKEFRHRHEGLAENRKGRQLTRYLERFRIGGASIRNIGPSRKAMLASYGVETAADVDSRPILKIPGFGDSLTADLLQWRRSHERNFRFNPQEPVPEQEIAALKQELEILG